MYEEANALYYTKVSVLCLLQTKLNQLYVSTEARELSLETIQDTWWSDCSMGS